MTGWLKSGRGAGVAEGRWTVCALDGGGLVGWNLDPNGTAGGNYIYGEQRGGGAYRHMWGINLLINGGVTKLETVGQKV